MKQFLFSKKFWAPWMILLIVLLMMELSSRAGWFDAMVSTRTYLGKALVRAEALEAYGHDNVEVISLGDSRLDWGLDHGRFRQALKQNNDQNYIRFTFEQSGFLAIQATAEWAIENLPNLDTIIIGFDGKKSEPKGVHEQIMIALPFIQHINTAEYVYHFTAIENLYTRVFRHTMLNWYLHEIRSWLRNPFKIIQQNTQFKQSELIDIWNYKYTATRNLCQYKLNSLQSCHQTAQRLEALKPDTTALENQLIKLCTSQYAINRLNDRQRGRKIPPQQFQTWQANWLKLFNKITSKNIKLNIVLLPETHISDTLITPINSDEFTQSLMNQAVQLDGVKVIDLSQSYKKNGLKECEIFSDYLHLNTAGIEYLTDELINSYSP